MQKYNSKTPKSTHISIRMTHQRGDCAQKAARLEQRVDVHERRVELKMGADKWG
jgi:hypothetical protein